MIGFLNQTILLAFPASLIPLLIHIFNRRRLKKLDFSSVQLLKTFEKTKLKRIRLKELILLILRCLIIFLVVVAFARPTWRGSLGVVSSSAQTSAVILLDNSFSTGYETREGSILDIGKRRSKELLKIFEENDEVSLVVFNSELELLNPQPTSDKMALSNLIKEVPTSFFTTDMNGALAFAREKLEGSKSMNKEIYLLSDLNRSGWLGEGMTSFKDQNVRLYIVKLWGEKKKNLSIIKTDSGEDLIIKDSPFELRAEVCNFSQDKIEDLLVALYLNKKRVSQTDVDLQPQSKMDLGFVQTENKIGIHNGFFEIEDDELLVDNRRYFTFYLPEKIKVLVLGEDQKDNYYINLALNPAEEKDWHFEVESVTIRSGANFVFSEYDVVILSNVGSLKKGHLNELDAFLKGGGGLILGLGGGIDLKSYNQNIMEKFFGAKISRFVSSEKGFSTLGKIDFDHPVFRVYKDEEEVPLVRFFSYFDFPEDKEQKVLARLKNQKPIFLEKDYGLGKILLFLSSFDSEGNDMVLHTFFVPFVHRCVEHLSRSRFSLGFEKDFLVGEEVERELFPSLFGKKLKLVDPRGKEFFLKPDFSQRNLKVKIAQTNSPGIYSVLADGLIVDQFALNLDPLESDLEVLTQKEIKKFLEGWNVVFVNPQDDLEKSIKASRYGRELGKAFLWLVFLLLFLELFLSRTGGGKEI